MLPPSVRLKLRMQPTRSAGASPSMRLSRISGCYFGKPLKSRTAAQTRSAGASITLEVYTFTIVGISSNSQVHFRNPQIASPAKAKVEEGQSVLQLLAPRFRGEGKNGER